MGIILQPFVDHEHNKIGIKHFDKTVVKGIPSNSNELNNHAKNWLNTIFDKKIPDTIHIWGVRKNDETRKVKDKAKRGDTVYFCGNKRPQYKATLLTEIVDIDYFDELWEKTKSMKFENVVYDRIYLVEDVESIPEQDVTSLGFSNPVRSIRYIEDW